MSSFVVQNSRLIINRTPSPLVLSVSKLPPSPSEAPQLQQRTSGERNTSWRARKRKRKKNDLLTEEVSKDMISELPMDIRALIVSLLPIKDAIRTCVLSRVWKNTWRWITIVDLDQEGLRLSDLQFKELVGRILYQRVSDYMDTLCLSFVDELEDNLVCAYHAVSLATRQKVRHLHLDLPMPEPTRLMMPNSFLNCKYLEILNMTTDFALPAPPSDDSFPNLRILRLDVWYPDSDSMSELFCHCSKLEELSLAGIMSFFCIPRLYFRIFVPSLKVLYLDWFLVVTEAMEGADEGEYKDPTHEFVIRTPSLQYLTIIDQSFASYKVEHIPSLIEVKLDVGNSSNDGFPLLEAISYSRVLGILESARSARSFVLSSRSYECLSGGFIPGSLPDFPFLVCLQLGIGLESGWKLLKYFLREFDGLEALVVTKAAKPKSDEHGHFRWTRPRKVPQCLLNSVKKIVLLDLWGSEDEVEVIKYLLEKGNMLEKMVIKFSVEVPDYMLEDLVCSEKSARCEIVFL